MPVLINKSAVEEMVSIKEKFESESVELEPCMEWADLENFEFPGDYRLYLLNVGNGVGAGSPCQEGVLEFGSTSSGYPLTSTDILTMLGKPFPYEDEHIVNEDKHITSRQNGDNLARE
ncbi:hypothetical protein [Parasitella parasitica]|uniref:Uncharacterized protein n=1 Tax=Parasitella parasitica TaxID=35722 RepID=A0A0B7NU59_9FUNG|nr:hypothetical protein [Parasitella parasitica]